MPSTPPPPGLESPTHALRADADPGAQSASSTYITLAQEHPYDRHIEVILHLSGQSQTHGAPLVGVFNPHWLLFTDLMHVSVGP